MTADPREMLLAIVEALVRVHGIDDVRDALEHVAIAPEPEPNRPKRRRVSPREAARRAAALVPADELARLKARRARG